MGKSSAASAANAVCDHVRDLYHGTKPGQFVSMGVISDGNPYGVPDGLVYSFPVSIEAGEWTIAPGQGVNEFAQDRITKTATELEEEKAMAFT